jgi:hypothetical protein
MKRQIGLKGLLAALAAVALLTSTVTVALALNFSDTAGSPFLDEIDKITDAGCASGFPDGTFRPQDQVKRQQFAFWLNNCGGRVAFAEASNTLTFANTENVALTDTITTGGASGSGQTQFLRVTGTAEVGGTTQSFDDFCVSLIECNIDVELHVNAPANPSGEVVSHQASWVTGASNPNEMATITVDAVVQVPTDTAITYSLRVQGTNLEASQGKVIDRTLTAVAIPFGAQGGNTL